MFKRKHFRRTDFVPGVVLSTLHLSTCFIVTPTTQGDINDYCQPFTDEDAEVQGVYVNWPEATQPVGFGAGV